MIKMIKNWLIYGLLLCSISCVAFSNKHTNTNKDKLSIVIFFSPTCPICQYYTTDINKIIDSLSIPVTVIIPKKSILSKKEIAQYYKNYNPHFVLQYDKRNKKVHKYRATITPEFYLLRNDTILYQGAFNDKFIDIGKKKSVIQNHYLFDAIYALNNNLLFVQKTEAVGCFIDAKK
ncbi:MAG: hypothetical protein U0T07_03360 [Chitinophagales bacterium]